MSVTPPSSWPWVDHPVSGLRHATDSPYSDSVSLRLPYSVKLATQRKSLTHYTKGTPSPSFKHPPRTPFGARVGALPSAYLLPGLALTRSAGKDPAGCLKLGSDCLYAYGFRIYCTPLPGFFSPFPHGTGSLSVDHEYLALEDGPPIFRQDFACPALLLVRLVLEMSFRVRGYHPLRQAFPGPFH